jgi:glycosidase
MNLRQELFDMARWWLEKGVDGYGFVVINYISKRPDSRRDENRKLMGYTGVEHYF